MKRAEGGPVDVDTVAAAGVEWYCIPVGTWVVVGNLWAGKDNVAMEAELEVVEEVEEQQ